MTSDDESLARLQAVLTALLKHKLSKKIVVLVPNSPGDLADKWVDEINTILADHPEVWSVTAQSISSVQAAFARPGIGFIVMREYYAKANNPWLTVEPPF